MASTLQTILSDVAHLRDKRLAAIVGGAVAMVVVGLIPGVNLTADEVAGVLVALGGVAAFVETQAKSPAPKPAPKK